MLEIPSALELESLSDSELLERITAITKIIKDSETLYGDDSDEQRLYRALQTDSQRRKATAATLIVDTEADAESSS